ncbi:hypothetical protein [Paraburkholderia franconis]|uniref:hypothetical protein n=1 Tax=Paraburkholderia franconis TaxID=2654983 RepID=UPI00187BAF99|nr:hypothetical protein [Paraburkholderia franconis]
MKRWKILGYSGLAMIIIVLFGCLYAVLQEHVIAQGVHSDAARLHHVDVRGRII